MVSCHYCWKTFEMAKEQERKVELPRVEPRAFALFRFFVSR